MSRDLKTKEKETRNNKIKRVKKILPKCGCVGCTKCDEEKPKV
jgi:hypothetical protein